MVFNETDEEEFYDEELNGGVMAGIHPSNCSKLQAYGGKRGHVKSLANNRSSMIGTDVIVLNQKRFPTRESLT